MRIPCPFCGLRDAAEFAYEGPVMDWPALSAAPDAWVEAAFLRDQPRGETRELWRHLHGCGCHIEILRNTVTHEIRETAFTDAADAKAMRAKP